MPLPLPEPSPERLASSPLELVVFQIQLSSAESTISEQTALDLRRGLREREAGLPVMEPQQNRRGSFAFSGQGELAPLTSLETRHGWRFRTTDNSWQATVFPDSIGLETTSYTTWDEFRARLQALLETSASILSIPIVTRAGLRYVDRIEELRLAQANAWTEYVQDFLSAPLNHAKLGPLVREAQQQLTISIDDDLACVLRHGTLAEGGRVDYLLDYDVFTTGAIEFEVAPILEMAAQMHLACKQLFYASIKDKLIDRFRDDA